MIMSDAERIRKIIDIWDRLCVAIDEHEITSEKLLQDTFCQWAVTTPLYNIGELVYQLTKEFKASYPDQPWNLVAGLRHRLVHDYEGINWSIIVDVIFHEMQPFIDSLKILVAAT